MPYARLQDDLPAIREAARAVQLRLESDGGELLEQLGQVAQLRGWIVHRASNPEEALDYICNLASSSATRSVVRSGQEVFQRVAVDAPLSQMGVEVTVMAQEEGLSREELRQRAAQAGIGLTGADYAIAETGSVVLLPRRSLSRLVSLLPPVHVALVSRNEVVDSLEDLFILRRLAYHAGDGETGSYMNFITGPSRTADIEQQLVVGVHGPREAHLVLLE